MKYRIACMVLAGLFAVGTASPASPESPDIYPPPEQAHSDLTAALKAAAAQHRRVILDFGGNWCPDCHALDIYMQQDSTNRRILDSSFVVVHINIGEKEDRNLDLAARYEIPLNKGVPALAILDSDGKLLYSQKTGEFEAMRHMAAKSVTEFLTHWKPS